MLDPTKLEAFNKNVNTNSIGTLIGNWQEELELRLAGNPSRNILMHHIPKVRQDLFNAPPDELNFTDPNLPIDTA